MQLNHEPQKMHFNISRNVLFDYDNFIWRKKKHENANLKAEKVSSCEQSYLVPKLECMQENAKKNCEEI